MKIEKAIQTAQSKAEACKLLGWHSNGKAYSKINHFIEFNNLSEENLFPNRFKRLGKENGSWKPDHEVSYKVVCWRHHKKQCVVCGEEKIVAVHHYDENKQNNHPTNLVPLCPTHHSYIHSRHKKEIQHLVDQYISNFKRKGEQVSFTKTSNINISKCNNFKDLIQMLGYSNGGNGYRKAQEFIVENNMDISHFSPKRTKTNDIDITDCNSLADVVRMLGYSTGGYGYKMARRYIRNYNLDISHFSE